MSTTIQIIDDNVALTTLLAKTLAKFDYTPVVENNPLLAINTARHYSPDIILLDVMMPERDGGRVLADLRADLTLRYIPVILLTGIAREAQALADTGGIHSIILSKPVQLNVLLDTIESQLREARTYLQQLKVETAEIPVPPIELLDFDDIEEIDHIEATERIDAIAPINSIRSASDAFSTESTPTVDFAFPKRDGEKEDPENLIR